MAKVMGLNDFLLADEVILKALADICANEMARLRKVESFAIDRRAKMTDGGENRCSVSTPARPLPTARAVGNIFHQGLSVMRLRTRAR